MRRARKKSRVYSPSPPISLQLAVKIPPHRQFKLRIGSEWGGHHCRWAHLVMGTRRWLGLTLHAHMKPAFVVGGEADGRAELWDIEPAALERQMPHPLRPPRVGVPCSSTASREKVVSLLLKLTTLTLSGSSMLLASVKTGQPICCSASYSLLVDNSLPLCCCCTCLSISHRF